MSENRVSYQLAYTGTGVARSFSCGFEPTRVEIVDLTDGTCALWLYGMAADSCQLVEDGSIVASGGVTVTDASRVIAVGTDNAVNKSGSAYVLWACR